MKTKKTKETITKDQAKGMLMDTMFIGNYNARVVSYSDHGYIIYLAGVKVDGDDRSFHSFWGKCFVAGLQADVKRYHYKNLVPSPEFIEKLIRESSDLGRMKR